MNLKSGMLIRLALAGLVATGAVNVWSDDEWYGGAEDAAVSYTHLTLPTIYSV